MSWNKHSKADMAEADIQATEVTIRSLIVGIRRNTSTEGILAGTTTTPGEAPTIRVEEALVVAVYASSSAAVSLAFSPASARTGADT